MEFAFLLNDLLSLVQTCVLLLFSSTQVSASLELPGTLPRLVSLSCMQLPPQSDCEFKVQLFLSSCITRHVLLHTTLTLTLTHTLHTLTYTLYALHTYLHTLTSSPPSPHSLRDESEVLPIAVPVLLSIPPDAHYAVRAATLRLVAVLAEWIDSHPDTLGE